MTEDLAYLAMPQSKSAVNLTEQEREDLLVVDNLSTHARSSLVRRLGAGKAEALWKRFILPRPRAESYAWNRTVNRQRLKIKWTFSGLGAAHVFQQQLQLSTRSRH